MIKKRTIPTILGIVVLIIGIAAGVLMIESRRVFRLGATPEVQPKNVRITNISDSSFTVSWTTDKETQGFIQWGEKASTLGKVATDSIRVPGFTHSTTLETLAPLITYYFKINSDGAGFDNSGIPWQVVTGPSLTTPPNSNVVFGSVLTPAGMPTINTLVYVTVGGSSPLSTVTQEDGSWIIPISSARDPSLNSYTKINETATLLEITVQAGPLGIASAQIYPAAARPVPPITLGQVHDFKSLPPVETGEVPKASVELPPESTPSSGFRVGDEAEAPEKMVTLENIQEGDIITFSELEFLGEGPSDAVLTITIESEPVTEQVTIGASGRWSLALAEGLSEGLHKITITWHDANGILRTLSRTFTVQAAGVEENPSSTPTPSPSPTPTLTPSPTPTSTPTPTPTKQATESATIDAGSLTPTFVLSIMGLGSLAFGIFIFTLSFDKTKD